MIEPVMRQSNSERASNESLTSRALHICRKSFKEFSAEKPLFGKLSERFWWYQYVCGSADVAAVVKDYGLKVGESDVKTGY